MKKALYLSLIAVLGITSVEMSCCSTRRSASNSIRKADPISKGKVSVGTAERRTSIDKKYAQLLMNGIEKNNMPVLQMENADLTDSALKEIVQRAELNGIKIIFINCQANVDMFNHFGYVAAISRDNSSGKPILFMGLPHLKVTKNDIARLSQLIRDNDSNVNLKFDNVQFQTDSLDEIRKNILSLSLVETLEFIDCFAPAKDLEIFKEELTKNDVLAKKVAGLENIHSGMRIEMPSLAPNLVAKRVFDMMRKGLNEPMILFRNVNFESGALLKIALLSTRPDSKILQINFENCIVPICDLAELKSTSDINPKLIEKISSVFSIQTSFTGTSEQAVQLIQENYLASVQFDNVQFKEGTLSAIAEEAAKPDSKVQTISFVDCTTPVNEWEAFYRKIRENDKLRRKFSNISDIKAVFHGSSPEVIEVIRQNSNSPISMLFQDIKFEKGALTSIIETINSDCQIQRITFDECEAPSEDLDKFTEFADELMEKEKSAL